MKVVDIADEIFRELNEPSTISIPSVAFWLRSNVGGLNNYIGASYRVLDGSSETDLDDGDTRTLTTTLEISQIVVNASSAEVELEIGEDEKSIFKKMYHVHYYDRLLRTNLTSISSDSVISVTDDGSSVTKINKNEISKVYSQIKRQEIEELKMLIGSYKLKNSSPLSVGGDDTFVGHYQTSDRFNRTDFNR
jgi:hypothetical protein